MQVTTIIKIILMVTFFCEVLIFGKFISALQCFKQGTIMSVAMTFSGMLFLSIAFLDIIPEAIANFDIYFEQSAKHVSSSSNLHSNSNIPLTMIIAMFTFLLIMYIDKILIGHSHDHEYEVSFASEPRRSGRDVAVELENMPPSSDNQSGQALQETQFNLRPFILQLGMSIHAFFECLAVGLQKTPLGVFGLASAILVHKWAEGLTLGLIYRKQNYNIKTTTVMIIVQGLMNVAGLIIGMIIIDQGSFVMAFFMSISAGTFLYISLVEVLYQQLSEMTKKKAISMICANIFIMLIVLLEKQQQQKAQKITSL